MKVELTALATGAEALRRLFFHARQNIITIKHAWAFRNTIDLLIGNHELKLITITTKPLKASFTINVPWTEVATLPQGFKNIVGCMSPDMHITLTYGPTRKFILRSVKYELIINLDKATVWKPSYPLSQGKAMFPQASEVFSVAKAFGYVAAITNSLPHPQVLIAVKDAINNITETHPSKVFNCLLKLTGLGHGLTPSADDIASGFAATINALIEMDLVMSDHLHVQVRELLSRTNLLSATLLHELITLNINEGIDGFVSSLVRGDIDNMLESLITLLTLGHDSGVSMGLGCLLAACIVSNANPSLCLDAFVKGADLSLV